MKKFFVENFQTIQKLRGNQYLKIFFIHVTPRDDSYEKYILFTVNKRSYIKKIRPPRGVTLSK